MTLTCRTCGKDFEAISSAYEECRACFLERIEKTPNRDEDDDLADTDVIEGDDPDDYIPD